MSIQNFPRLELAVKRQPELPERNCERLNYLASEPLNLVVLAPRPCVEREKSAAESIAEANHVLPPPSPKLPSLNKSSSTFFANRAASTSERIDEFKGS